MLNNPGGGTNILPRVAAILRYRPGLNKLLATVLATRRVTAAADQSAANTR